MSAVADAPAPERHIRTPWSLPVFAMLVCSAFVGVTTMPAISYAEAEDAPAQQRNDETQSVFVAGERTDAGRDSGYTVIDPPKNTAPATGMPDLGSAQAIAFDMLTAKGWDTNEYNCLVALWNRESHWNIYAYNPTSGAYGIPQALPGDKMATVAADWKTNPRTQIIWGLGYIEGRYATPCGAWAHSERKGWY